MGEFEDTSGVTKFTKISTTDITAGEGTIGATELATNAVETAKIKNLNVTGAKIANDTILETKLGGVLITGATDTTAGTETTHAHGLGIAPSVIIFTSKANGIVYKSKDSDATNIYAKGSANALAFEAYCLK